MQDRLKEIRDRVDNISGEDWVFDKVLSSPKEKEITAAIVEQVQGHAKYRITVQSFGKKAIMADAEFIANSPADIKFLLASLQEADDDKYFLRKQTEEANRQVRLYHESEVLLRDRLKQSQDRERVLREALSSITTCYAFEHGDDHIYVKQVRKALQAVK